MGKFDNSRDLRASTVLRTYSGSLSLNLGMWVLLETDSNLALYVDEKFYSSVWFFSFFLFYERLKKKRG